MKRGNKKHMSKKDYELIAGAVKLSVENMDKPAHKDTLESVLYSIAWHLSIDNPRFDRQRFIEACGVEV